MKKEIIIIIFGLLGIGILWSGRQAYEASRVGGGGVACTAEAKLCPDGTSVGRTGPNCEFSACPDTDQIQTKVGLNQTIVHHGISITPLEVLEDSRCPVDAECLWAGTVRVRVTLESEGGVQETTFSLESTITFAGNRVKLSGVMPAARAGVKIATSEYLLQFEVAGDTLQGTGGIRGAVLLGPTCPVMREPPEPGCADKPYATRLAVTTADGARVVQEFTSDAQGTFSVSVPAGSYAIRSAVAANVLPYCSSRGTITVQGGAYAEETVYCDTGIR